MTAKHNEIQFSDSDVVNVCDFIPHGEFNPHNVRPWLLHDHGFVVAVVFADCEGDALDVAADEGKLDRFRIADEDLPEYGEEERGVSRLGNASDPFSIEAMGIEELPIPAFSFAAMFAASQAS